VPLRSEIAEPLAVEVGGRRAELVAQCQQVVDVVG
jgi:hypothetical protein